MPGPADPPAPEPTAHPPQRSGPADVPVSVIVAAQGGDAGAFATLATHWQPHLRTFVHLVLAGEGETDRVLAAAFLRAYRALPRYRAEERPGLWLHRIAFLAATDELRRLTRDPRLRGGVRRERPAPTSLAEDPGGAFPPGWRVLDPDQRALLAMIDREGFDPRSAAEAMDSPVTVVLARVGPARRAMSFAAGNPPDVDEDAVLPERTRAALATVVVPPAGADFWPTLGRRLLAEQVTPAAPTPDPLDRLHRAHPATPGFRPVASPSPHAAASQTDIADLADQAERIRPPRRWAPIVITVVAVAAVAALLAVAVAIGTSSELTDGSVAATEVGADVAAAQASTTPVEVEARVTESGRAADTTTRRYRVTLAPDGSWFVGARGAIEAIALDAPTGTARRVAVVGAGGTDPTVLASEETGLSTGDPDPTAARPDFLQDLAVAGTVLRSARSARAIPTSEGGVGTYTVRRDLRTGIDGALESWEIEARRGDHRLVRIERRADGRLVRRTILSAWRPTDEADPGTFSPQIPPGVEPVRKAEGFLSTDIAGVAILGRGPAVTPAWLPAGYRLASVMIRPDGKVVSMGFQRGAEHLTITTREVADPSAWPDPFGPRTGEGSPEVETLRNGRFNGARIAVTPGPAGDARLWGAVDDDEMGPTGFTVSGGLTVEEARRVAGSLR